MAAPTFVTSASPETALSPVAAFGDVVVVKFPDDAEVTKVGAAMSPPTR